MRKLLAWPFEMIHLLGTAVFFALGLLLTLLVAVHQSATWLPKLSSKLSPSEAAERFAAVSTIVGANAVWLAGAALIGAVIAPFARGDGTKKVAWARIVCAVATLVLVAVIWSGQGGDWTGKAALAANGD